MSNVHRSGEYDLSRKKRQISGNCIVAPGQVELATVQNPGNLPFSQQRCPVRCASACFRREIIKQSNLVSDSEISSTGIPCPSPGWNGQTLPEGDDAKAKAVAAGAAFITTSFTELLSPIWRRRLQLIRIKPESLVLLRPGGKALNTTFELFPKPMGVAAAGGRLAIWNSHRDLGISQTFLPSARNWINRSRVTFPCRRSVSTMPPGISRGQVSFTGNIQIHEMAWSGAAGDELWVVNHGVLLPLRPKYQLQFHPRWRPPFSRIWPPEESLPPDGIALRDRVPRYVTSAGTGNAPGQWRRRTRNPAAS